MLERKLDHFFRKEHGKLVSIHTSRFGITHLELVEDAVQDTLLEATELWRFSGFPENPEGWLYKVSKNKCLDKLKYQKVRIAKQEDVARWYESNLNNTSFDHIYNDEQLIMMFTCAHPLLKKEDQIALTLKILCGFSTQEIAQAFLSNKKTIEQRIVRAKKRLRDQNIQFMKPTKVDIQQKLPHVLQTIYLLFNEGYHSNSKATQIRKDLCADALRLTQILLGSPLSKKPDVYALQALICFQISRFDSRLSDEGDILLLEEQDRSKWDQHFISMGLKALEQASSGNLITEYHLQAGIAACHAISENDEDTNWGKITVLYDALIQQQPNPIIKLNAAVARYMNKEKIIALDQLKSLKGELDNYYLYPATMGEIYLRENQFKEAKLYFEKALILAENPKLKQYIKNKIKISFP